MKEFIVFTLALCVPAVISAFIMIFITDRLDGWKCCMFAGIGFIASVLFVGMSIFKAVELFL